MHDKSNQHRVNMVITRPMQPVAEKMDKMATEIARKLDHVDSAATTARIDRRQTVLAQIEAALLADKLSVLEIAGEGSSNGTDPYNCGRTNGSTWGKASR